jgi:branched-chain amino acid transport system ATP-binding protein
MVNDANHLELRSVSLAFGGVQALVDVSFRVNVGETLGIVGPNGAGKSSLINCLTGFYSPKSGSIHLGDVNIIGLKPWRVSSLGLARTFQQTSVVVESSVMDNVLLGRHAFLDYGLASASLRGFRARRHESAAREEAERLLDILGIGHLATSSLERLTFGQRKLVEVARALMSKPRFLFLDEPVSGMTYEEKREVAAAIEVIHQDSEIGIVVIEHDLWFVRTVCARAIALDFGRMIGDGPSDEVIRSESLVAAYLCQAPTPTTQ